MRRRRLPSNTKDREMHGRIVVPFLLSLSLSIGCGHARSVESPKESFVRSQTPAPPCPSLPPTESIVATNGATIVGIVCFKGIPPPMKIINFFDVNCKAMHNAPVTMDTVVVNPNGTLKNVFVYVKEGLGKRTSEPPSQPVGIET